MPVRNIIEAVGELSGENFEDPSRHTPRDDGDFVYIWGGPYDTRDIIENIFADDLTEMEVEEVAAALEQHSSEWVPNQSRQQLPDDYYDESAAIKAPSTHDLHARMLAPVKEAEDRLEALGPVRASGQAADGIGHNRPPEPIDDAPITFADVEAVRTALASLKAQPSEPGTEEQKVAEAAKEVVQTAGQKIGNWAKDRASDFASEFFKELLDAWRERESRPMHPRATPFPTGAPRLGSGPGARGWSDDDGAALRRSPSIA